jgi:hypothetical protein
MIRNFLHTEKSAHKAASTSLFAKKTPQNPLLSVYQKTSQFLHVAQKRQFTPRTSPHNPSLATLLRDLSF